MFNPLESTQRRAWCSPGLLQPGPRLQRVSPLPSRACQWCPSFACQSFYMINMYLLTRRPSQPRTKGDRQSVPFYRAAITFLAGLTIVHRNNSLPDRKFPPFRHKKWWKENSLNWALKPQVHPPPLSPKVLSLHFLPPQLESTDRHSEAQKKMTQSPKSARLVGPPKASEAEACPQVRPNQNPELPEGGDLPSSERMWI